MSNTLQNKEVRLFYGLMISFMAVSVYLLTKEAYWICVVPLLIVIIYLAAFAIDKIILLIAFFTPLAIVLNDKSSGPALSIPTEPLMFGVLLLFIFKFLFEGKFDRKVLYHPVTIALGFHLTWMFITSLTSTIPGVSFKHVLSQLWFIVPFYLLGTQMFKDLRNIKRFIWAYAFTLFIVVAYTIFNHAANGWTQKAAHWVMVPFYNDHTAYAAVLALFIPPLIAFASDRHASFRERFIAGFFTFVFIIAIVLSYTRAAWLSLIIALILYFVYYFRVKFYTVFFVTAGLFTVFMVLRSDIVMKLEKNRQDSATDFNKHIQSISNISTDASNLERINRWNSALRMWKEKPFWGWGPGTYQFNYAPFQKSNEMTIISTNAGNMGNAHSEFIGPLAEEGVLGMAAMIIVVGLIIYRASVLYSIARDPKVRLLTLGIILGFITYFIHGVLNNFLDTDKLAVPVWAFAGMLVAMDVYHSGRREIKKIPFAN